MKNNNIQHPVGTCQISNRLSVETAVKSMSLIHL